jgi:hypothetical protein
MISAEYDQAQSVEFLDIPYRSQLDMQVAEMLRPATREVAVWYKRLDPPRGWYHRVFDGLMVEGSDLDKFRSDYEKNGNRDGSDVRSPYTIINEDWQGENMVSNPSVKEPIQNIADQIKGVAEWIDKQPDNQDYQEFDKYLDKTAQLLPAGRFDDAMVEFLKLSSKSSVRWMALPVEYVDDPMKEKASPQGLLAYMDREETNQANEAMNRYNQAFKEIYGQGPFPAWVFRADVVVNSGWLGKKSLNNKALNAFNIPNDPRVGRKAGHNVIMQHPAIIEQFNNVLSAGLYEVAGVETSTKGTSRYIDAHEAGHGYREEEEARRLIQWRGVMREGWASARAVVGTDPRFFSSEEIASVIDSKIGFALFDSSGFRTALFEPMGQNQPSLVELAADSIYTPDGYIVSRQGILRGAFGRPNGKFGEINYDIMREISKERDVLYAQIAKSGDVVSAPQLINKYYQEKVYFNGYGPKADLGGVSNAVG